MRRQYRKVTRGSVDKIKRQKNKPQYNLVGLRGWWRRREQEGLKEVKARRKEEVAL